MLFYLNKKLLPTFLLRFIVFVFILLSCNITYADAPFISDDPETMNPGEIQGILYSTADQSKAMTTIQAPALEMDFGVLPNIEIDIYTPFTENSNVEATPRHDSQNASGIGDIDIELKYRFLQETSFLPQVAFIPNWYVPTGDARQGLGNGSSWYQLPLSAEKTFGSWTTYVEAGYALNSAPHNRNFIFGGWVVTNQMTPKASLGGEIYSQGASAYLIGSYTLFNIGAQYKLTHDSTLLAGLGHSILGQQHWVAYLGMAWA